MKKILPILILSALLSWKKDTQLGNVTPNKPLASQDSGQVKLYYVFNHLKPVGSGILIYIDGKFVKKQYSATANNECKADNYGYLYKSKGTHKFTFKVQDQPTMNWQEDTTITIPKNSCQLIEMGHNR